MTLSTELKMLQSCKILVSICTGTLPTTSHSPNTQLPLTKNVVSPKVQILKSALKTFPNGKDYRQLHLRSFELGGVPSMNLKKNQFSVCLISRYYRLLECMISLVLMVYTAPIMLGSYNKYDA